MVLTDDGKVYIGGDNEYYQVGMGDHSAMIGKTVREPQLNEYLKDENIIDIKAGYYHNVVKTDNNEFYLWGNNEDYECLVFDFEDDEDEEYVKIPTQFTFENKEIIAIYPGFY
eukprot:CAMPEP_0201589264 /NCGR_PEP_ID=MMETSP0190_2-20130828/164720_1 /ASSEMBLY_ACC=CAM_ASM_000263 /TAXON_ID=37353 /ORGANISM="Rosalina sp." /LENGTH=112 /DNA_ID=CAMNT_0048043077 /DNA_START=239 /DNA_END=574 /DNA_ORIENTATION=+